MRLAAQVSPREQQSECYRHMRQNRDPACGVLLEQQVPRHAQQRIGGPMRDAEVVGWCCGCDLDTRRVGVGCGGWIAGRGCLDRSCSPGRINPHQPLRFLDHLDRGWRQLHLNRRADEQDDGCPAEKREAAGGQVLTEHRPALQALVDEQPQQNQPGRREQPDEAELLPPGSSREQHSRRRSEEQPQVEVAQRPDASKAEVHRCDQDRREVHPRRTIDVISRRKPVHPPRILKRRASQRRRRGSSRGKDPSFPRATS